MQIGVFPFVLSSFYLSLSNWEPLERVIAIRGEMEGAQEAPSKQYARSKWKVARDFCRYNWKWPLTAYEATFNVISLVQAEDTFVVRESQATFMSTTG